MFTLTNEIAREFGDKIRHNVEDYLVKFHEFFRFEFPNFVAYFSGKKDELSSIGVLLLEELISENEAIENKIVVSNRFLTNVDDWEVVEYLADLSIELLYFKKIDKFLRSSVTSSQFNNKFEFNTTLKSETIENLSNRLLKSDDYNNDWVDIAKRNDLQELDYTHQGGNDIIVSVDLNVNSGTILGVIDNLIGQRVLGLDLHKKIAFMDDDLLVLGFEDTFHQAVSILSILLKGDVPEFKDFGRAGFVGGNMKSFAISSLIRQLTTVFSTDDTMTNFKIKRFTFESGGIAGLAFEVSTRLDVVSQNEIPIKSI